MSFKKIADTSFKDETSKSWTYKDRTIVQEVRKIAK